MLDWKPGDKLVAVSDGGGCEDFILSLLLPDLVIGRVYTINFLAVTTDPCESCDSELIVSLMEHPGKGCGYCTCCFRKPIDFRKLCKVDQIKRITIKELTDA